jgi:hypothetical protein
MSEIGSISHEKGQKFGSDAKDSALVFPTKIAKLKFNPWVQFLKIGHEHLI